MPTPVIMPKFGMAQEEGTIIRWLKQEGEAVKKGETLLEVQTDKVDMEVESPANGVLGGILFGPDSTVKVTTVIGEIYGESEVKSQKSEVMNLQSLGRISPIAQRMAAERGIDLSRVTGSGVAGMVTRADVEALIDASAGAPSPSMAHADEKPRATPAARRLARDAQINLADVAGSGPNGRIHAADVVAHLQKSEVKSQKSEVRSQESPLAPLHSPLSTPLKGMRKTIATRLTASWQTIPHVTFTMSVDMTQAEALRAQLGGEVEKRGGKFTPTVLIAKAVAMALTRHPRMNAWLQEVDGNWLLTQHTSVNLGIAVSLEDGLIVPVVRQAQTLGLGSIASQIADLSQRARNSQLKPDEVQEGTFTLSNLGSYPLDHFTAIINPPQVAILAIGRSQMQPVWDGTAFHPKPVLQMTLSADHRAVDGAVAAAFLTDVKELLEMPSRMML